MAAKKRSTPKKTVTIKIDVETIKKLADATDALSELANALILASNDPELQAKAKKGAKKRR